MDPVVKQNIMSLYKVDSAAKGDQASQGFDIKVSQKLPALTIPDEEIAISLDDFIAVLVEKGDEYVAHGKEDLAAFAVKTEALHFVVEVTRAPKVASILLEDITETLKNAILTLVNKAQKDTSYESSQPMAVDTEELQRHFAAISNAARSPNTVTEADLGRIVSDLLDWAKKHPWQVAFHLTCAILLLSPGIVVGPILGYIGFSSEGVVAGSAAAAYQSIAGPIVARSFFAYLQSAGAGGYGLWRVYAVVRGAIVMAEAFEIGVANVRKAEEGSGQD